MIHIVKSPFEQANRSLLETMFADRKALFVDLYGWNLPVVGERFEIDQYDTPDTLYIIAADADGRHQASIRLMPTTSPHMLAEIFPHLCPGGVPTGPHVWESTRLCLPQRHGAEGRRQFRNRLISRMVDLALDQGVTTLTGVLPDPFRKEVLAMGWAAEPLGPAVRSESGLIGAFAVHLAPDTPDRLRWSGTYVDKGREAVA